MEEHTEDEVGHARGYYEDGVYYAAPLVKDERGEGEDAAEDDYGQYDGVYDDDEAQDDELDEEDGIAPQVAYTSSLLARLQNFRESLAQKIPESEIQQLDPDAHPTYSSTSRKHSFDDEMNRWQGILSSSSPKPIQLAAMSRETALVVLEAFTRNLTLDQLSQRSQGQRLGAWVWGLLARLGELGTLNSEEVSVIRECAKKAARIVRGAQQEAVVNVPVTPNPGPENSDEADHKEASAKGAHSPSQSSSEGSFDEELATDVVEVSYIKQDVAGDGGEDISTHDERITGQDTEESGRRFRNTSSPLSSPELHTVQQRTPDAGTISETDPKEDSNAAKASCQDTLIHDERPGTGSDHPRHYSHYQNEEKGSLQQADTSWAFATLDMIVAIVGIHFGQRDLLGVRERVWGLPGSGPF